MHRQLQWTYLQLASIDFYRRPGLADAHKLSQHRQGHKPTLLLMAETLSIPGKDNIDGTHVLHSSLIRLFSVNQI